MQDIIELLYDNFITMMVICIAIAVISVAVVFRIFTQSVQTRLLIVGETTAQIVPVRERLNDKILLHRKTRYAVRGNPVYLVSERVPTRLYVAIEGGEEALSLPAVLGEVEHETDSTDIATFRRALENDVIEQCMKGLVSGMRPSLLFILSLILTGMGIYAILQMLSGG